MKSSHSHGDSKSKGLEEREKIKLGRFQGDNATHAQN